MKPKKRPLRIFVFLIFLSFLSISSINQIYAQSEEGELSNKIKGNNIKIEDLQKEINEYTKKISDKKGDARTLTKTLEILKDTKSKLLKDIQISEYKIKNTKHEIEETENKIYNITIKIENLKKTLEVILKDINQQRTQNSNQLLLFLNDKSISQILDTYERSNDFKTKLNKSIKEFYTLKSALDSSKIVYRDKVKTLESSRTELSERRNLVTQNEADKIRILKETKNEESSFQLILAERRKQKLELEKEIFDFESKIKALVDSSRLPKAGNGVLSYPLKNIKITQYFGNTPFSTKNPQVYNGAGHNGIDFAAQVGTEIYSAGDGVVIGTGDTDLSCRGASYGKWILIKHDNGLATLYAHLSTFTVSDNAKVIRGDKIGLSGNTGYSTGPHLHFAVFANDGVRVSGEKEYKSRACGTFMKLPLAPRNAYLNPLTYL